MADEVLVLAYDAALSALREQDSTLSNLRNRATSLLAAATVGTSLVTSVGVLHTDPTSKVSVFPAWAAWVLLGLVIVMGTSVMVVLWPTPRWSYGPDPNGLLKRAGEDLDNVRRLATKALVIAIATNNQSLKLRVLAYRIGAVMLLVEIAVLILGLLFNYR